jgi:hypothetical protein
MAEPKNSSPWKIVLKALALFVVFNVLYVVTQPLRLLNRLSVYNALVPGRERLPFSEYPAESYSLTVTDLNQMLASHEIARPKAPGEFRVIMLGDSSIWGYLLKPDETQAACLNRLNLTLPSGKHVRVYNLGYPTLTVMKDLLILRHALPYQPDLILWPTSLASLYTSDQLGFPIIKAQYDEVAALIAQYGFKFGERPLPAPTWFDRTFFGQRRPLADWLRYQLYGLDWAATGIDHVVPKFVTPHPVNLLPDDLSLDVVKVGIDTAAALHIPVLLINEPIYRSDSSPVRWNTYYPRWAYDTYRQAMQEVAAREGWHYVDFWDAATPDQFTDTDFHLTPAANCAYAEKLSAPLLQLASEVGYTGK